MPSFKVKQGNDAVSLEKLVLLISLSVLIIGCIGYRRRLPPSASITYISW